MIYANTSAIFRNFFDKSYRKGMLLMIFGFEAQKVYIYYVYIQYKEVICKNGVLSYGNPTGILR